MKEPSQDCKYCKGLKTCPKEMPTFQPDYPIECNFCLNQEGIWFSAYHKKHIVKCKLGKCTSVWSYEKYGDCKSFKGGVSA